MRKNVRAYTCRAHHNCHLFKGSRPIPQHIVAAGSALARAHTHTHTHTLFSNTRSGTPPPAPHTHRHTKTDTQRHTHRHRQTHTHAHTHTHTHAQMRTPKDTHPPKDTPKDTSGVSSVPVLRRHTAALLVSALPDTLLEGLGATRPPVASMDVQSRLELCQMSPLQDRKREKDHNRFQL